MATVHELVPGVVHFLVDAARAGRPTTYGKVAEALGTHPRVVPQVLEVVRALCLDKGWPPLTVLVLQAGQKRPGEAFLDPWMSRDTPQAVKDAKVEEFLQRVYSFDWTPLLERYPLRGAVAAGTQAAASAVSVTLKLTPVDGAIYVSTDGFHTLIDRRPGSPYCHVELYERLKAALVATGQWER